MPSLKKLFNFFHDQGRVDKLGSGVAGVAVAGAVAAIAGLLTANPVLAIAGLATELGTITIATAFLAAALETFKPKTFAATAALTLAGIFGLAAALPAPDAGTTQAPVSWQLSDVDRTTPVNLKKLPTNNIAVGRNSLQLYPKPLIP